MKVLAIVHERDAGPGVFADAVEARGGRLEQWFIPDEPEPPAPLESYGAVLAFGGAMNTDQESDHPWLEREKAFLRDIIEAEIPVLGVCLGGQLVAEAAGAVPQRAPKPEIGWFGIELTAAGKNDEVLGAIDVQTIGFQWHSYEFPLPPGAVALARSPVCLQAFRSGDRVWGIQFHAEVTSEDALSWIRNYGKDEDAVIAGVDPEKLNPETRDRIGGWNETGRELCARFLDAAAGRRGGARQSSSWA